jgi:beta-lactamase superfamily II metal-dependent hydrolase
MRRTINGFADSGMGEAVMKDINRREFMMATTSALAFPSVLHGVATSSSQSEGQNGTMFEPWRHGYLDIHHISTGRGSSVFILCPDGTTMMIDAGAILSLPDSEMREKYLISPKPDGSRRPGEWIARYVERQMAAANRKEIDYFILTHFHVDHLGEVIPGNLTISPLSKHGDYQLSGLTDVAEAISIKTILDRNYPDYNYPVPLNSPVDQNYHAFLRSFTSLGGKVERIIPGSNRQIVLKQSPHEFPTFDVRNLAANGEVWTGVADQTRQYFPSLSLLQARQYPTENKCSLAVRLSYGKFDYFAAGDMEHDTEYGLVPWGDIETPVARVAGPVDVAAANHHGYVDACGPEWVRALSARAYIINSWSSDHPAMPGLHNMLSKAIYPGPRDVISTAMKPENAIAVKHIAEMRSTNGHVVIRVHPGGDSYDIFIRDNSDEENKVVAHIGPYTST